MPKLLSMTNFTKEVFSYKESDRDRRRKNEHLRSSWYLLKSRSRFTDEEKVRAPYRERNTSEGVLSKEGGEEICLDLMPRSGLVFSDRSLILKKTRRCLQKRVELILLNVV